MTPAAGLLSRFCLLLGVASVALAGQVLTLDPALAQSVKKQSKTAATGVDGRNTVIEGIKAYEARKDDKAVATLSKAVSAGGLSSQDLAKAFYYRGMSYQRTGKSAQAIADLTNAVWMRGGLSPEEQKKALEIRGQAYAKLGVPDPGPPVTSVGTPSSTAAVAAPAAAPTVATKNTASPGPAATSNAVQDVPAAGFSTQVSKAGEAAPQTGSTASGSSNPLSGVGNFFSNLFSGGSSEPSEPAAAASTAPAATVSIAAPSTQGAVSAVSAWSSETSVSAANTKVAAVAVPKQTKTAAPQAPSGAYNLQVAAVRSKTEAERLAQQLSQKHGGQIGARIPHISETVFGNMGTFYQVNVGPFAKVSETDKVCRVLKSDGFDCLVVKK